MDKLELMKTANEIRKGVITAVHSAKSGHPGGSLSAADIYTYLYFEEMNIDPKDPRKADRDRFVQSHLISYYTKMEEIGTMAVMKLENESKRTSREVFDSFTPLEEGFVKTMIPMKEMCPLGDPVARSQARRILRRLDEFREIIFDFCDIDFMGQGFADEVFRVFQNQHPDITLTVINANESVLGMIRHIKR